MLSLVKATSPASKSQQLQIRVSPTQKRAIQRQAEKARMSMSAWILSRVLPSSRDTFQGLIAELSAADDPRFAFADLLDWLGALDADALEAAIAEPPEARLDRYWETYLAATVEHAAAACGAEVPGWAREVPPLDEPVFGSSLESLRLHLLRSAPPAFARRNLFVDASVGDRV